MAPEGNKFWMARSSHGRKPAWSSPEELEQACYQYFEWVEANPLKEAIVYQGVLNKEDGRPLMRPMTLSGLCIFLGVSQTTWKDYRHKKDPALKKDFSTVVMEVDEIIKTQKFEGAAAGLFNPNIIARDLGLKEATTNEHTGKDGGPIQTEDSSAKDKVRDFLASKSSGTDTES